MVGTAKQRVPDTVNRNIATGEVELIAEELRILNESKQPPFLPSETVLPNEEMRLKYRYIDLRRDAMQYNIELRHKVALAIRDYLSAQGFFEIETPFMTRSTPEGARDYLVPSRVQPGSFYALPQSPQMFKQILMISGFDKYFQIVRCFRDEDLRADRQPEFTQIDLEMSYPQSERVWEVVEGFLTAAFKAAGHEIKTPFPRMSYDEAMRLYGSDKPDMRLPAMADVRSAFTPEEVEKFAAAFKVGPDFTSLLIRIPKAGEISGTERRTIGTYGAFASGGLRRARWNGSTLVARTNRQQRRDLFRRLKFRQSCKLPVLHGQMFQHSAGGEADVAVVIAEMPRGLPIAVIVFRSERSVAPWNDSSLWRSSASFDDRQRALLRRLGRFLAGVGHAVEARLRLPAADRRSTSRRPSG